MYIDIVFKAYLFVFKKHLNIILTKQKFFENFWKLERKAVWKKILFVRFLPIHDWEIRIQFAIRYKVDVSVTIFSIKKNLSNRTENLQNLHVFGMYSW